MWCIYNVSTASQHAATPAMKGNPMKVEIQKWGNSAAIRLPSAVLGQVGARAGDRLDLRTEDGRIVLAPAARQYELAELVEAITTENRHEAVEFGPARGREAW